MSNLYITLSSNADNKYYPNNTLANFYNRLSLPLDLHDGGWEVGLAEIQYPYNWHNVHKNEVKLRIEKKPAGDSLESSAWKTENVVLPAGQYKSPEFFTETLNTLIKTEGSANSKTAVQFSYSKATKKAWMKKNMNTWVIMSPKLERMLGFTGYDPARERFKTFYRGMEDVDLEDGIHHFFVYANCVDHRPVGQDMLPLLRVLPVSGSQGSMNEMRTFRNIQYVPTRRQVYEALEIDIRSVTGEPIPFQRGHLLVTLHFRRTT